MGSGRGKPPKTIKKTRCILSLDLLGQFGISTTQRTAPSELLGFDVLLYKQSKGWIIQFFKQIQTTICKTAKVEIITHFFQTLSTHFVQFKRRRGESPNI